MGNTGHIQLRKSIYWFGLLLIAYNVMYKCDNVYNCGLLSQQNNIFAIENGVTRFAKLIIYMGNTGHSLEKVYIGLFSC